MSNQNYFKKQLEFLITDPYAHQTRLYTDMQEERRDMPCPFNFLSFQEGDTRV